MQYDPNVLVDVIIVARNCARALDLTLSRLPRRGLRSIIVVDNGSTDRSGQVARDHGCVVLRAPRGGYGSACARALQHLEALPVSPSVVVFVDPVGPEDPADLGRILAPFRHENAELVLSIGPEGEAAEQLSDRALIGLIGFIYGHSFTELSSLRALRYSALVALGLGADGEGWSVEMLVKAVRLGLHIVEVPVSRLEKPASLGQGERGHMATGRKLFRILRHAAAR